MRAGCRYCSPSCAAHGGAVAMSEEALSARGRRAAAAAAAKRHARAEAAVAGLSPLEAYRRGYRNGLSAYRSALARKRQQAARGRAA